MTRIEHILNIYCAHMRRTYCLWCVQVNIHLLKIYLFDGINYDGKSIIYCTKVQLLNCLLFIYKMMQASKVNESISKYSKTGLCITEKVLRMLSQGNTKVISM